MFGRRKRSEQAAEAAREAERRVLFAELANRPDSVCPFLGLVDARAGYRPEPNAEHRCYAFGDPAPLSDEQQRHVCLERGYSNCPRYLRGVLVIPSEELEALRRPQAPAPPPPPAPAARGRRRGLLILPLLLVLVAAVAVGGWYAMGGGLPGIGRASPTPDATAIPSPVASSSPSPTVTAAPASPTATSAPTPIVIPSSGVLPTPGPSDTPTGTYAVVVKTGSYPVFAVDDNGVVGAQKTAVFAPEGVPYSGAPVKRIQGQDGRLYWRTEAGTYSGLAYTKGLSGDFAIYEVYATAQQDVYTYRKLPDAQR